MPNWVYISMTVRGEEKLITEFLEKYFSIDEEGNKYLDFEKIIHKPWYVIDETGAEIVVERLQTRLKQFGGLVNEKNLKEGLEVFSDKFIKNGIIYPNIDEISGFDLSKMTEVQKAYAILGGKIEITDEDMRFLKKYMQPLNEKQEKMISIITDWYNWNISFWGTKWNATTEDIRLLDKYSIQILFQTAWAFPEPIYRKLIYDNIDLDFHVKFLEESFEYAVEFVNEYCIKTLNSEQIHEVFNNDNEAYEWVGF